MKLELLRLTQIVRSPLVDPTGETLGRVDDLVVRLGGRDYPPVAGLKARIGGRHVFVPINQVAELGAERVQLTGTTVNVRRFERREGEVLLQHFLLAIRAVQIWTGHQ